MRQLLKKIIVLISIFVILISIMAIFSLCPPEGPWPTPPWCDSCKIKIGGHTNLTMVVSIPYNSHNSNIRLLIKGTKPRVMEQIGYLTYKTTIPVVGQEEIEYMFESIDGISKQKSTKITKKNMTIYDGVSSWSNLNFSPAFLKNFEFDMMMFDTWGRNYNFLMIENTRDNIESSFERLKQLKIKKVVVTDMFRVVSNKKNVYNSTDYKIEDAIFLDDFRDESLTKKDMINLAKSAHRNGMKLAVETSISFINYGKYMTSRNIREDWDADLKKQTQNKTKDWVEDFYDKKEKKLLEVVHELDDAGVDEIFVNQRNEIPLEPYEDYANKRLVELIDKIHNESSLKVNFFVKEKDVFYDDWNKKKKLFDSADNLYIIIERVDKRYKPFYGMNFTNIKNNFSALLNDYRIWAEYNNLSVNVYFGVSSYKDSIINGYIEFNDIRNPMIKKLVPDWQYQADVYEAFLQSAENYSFIKGITFMGYWWDDAMDPETAKTRISISFSNRNKNVESTINKWTNTIN